MKSQSTSQPVSCFVHSEASETTGAALLASTHGWAWWAVPAPGHLPEASHPTQGRRLHRGMLGCLEQLSPSTPACQHIPCSQQLQGQTAQEAKAALRDGCTGPSVTISSRWPHWEAPGLPEGLQWDILLPCPSHARIQPVLVHEGHWNLDIHTELSFSITFSVIESLAFTKPWICIPCTLLSRVSPSSIYLAGTHQFILSSCLSFA